MTYNFNDEKFKKTSIYQTFIDNNPGIGYLKIRASAASEALPISNLKIVVLKKIDNDNIIFYEGMTDKSGIIDKITLPTPRLGNSDLAIPQSITYQIKATYDNITNIYEVNVYENIYVVQAINIIPTLSVMMGDNKWP